MEKRRKDEKKLTLKLRYWESNPGLLGTRRMRASDVSHYTISDCFVDERCPNKLYRASSMTLEGIRMPGKLRLPISMTPRLPITNYVLEYTSISNCEAKSGLHKYKHAKSDGRESIWVDTVGLKATATRHMSLRCRTRFRAIVQI